TRTAMTIVVMVQRTSNVYCWFQVMKSSARPAGRPAIIARSRMGGAGRRWSRLLTDAILLQAAVECTPAHTELFGGQAHVTAVACENFLDERPLGVFDRQRLRRAPSRLPQAAPQR